MEKINVAIDGPAGAGKSSISKEVAKKLGYIYVDTGAMYRAVGLKFLDKSIEENDAEFIKSLNETTVDIKYTDGVQHIFLDGEDVSALIRTQKVSQMASDVSKIGLVREKLLSLQKNLAKNNDCIMDGRDIGTTILPDAKVKIFLTASAEERAKRRCKDLENSGQSADYETVLNEIIIRDKNDSERKISPLKMADDAILVDTSHISYEESVNTIYNIIIDKIN
ncbi:MAG: (d)CMP kinase [Ruminococcaceae bacterium]|nr:(d)CMP kinase [Oscillospiraceae bacterium]